jgi:hypothetical protein
MGSYPIYRMIPARPENVFGKVKAENPLAPVLHIFKMNFRINRFDKQISFRSILKPGGFASLTTSPKSANIYHRVRSFSDAAQDLDR